MDIRAIIFDVDGTLFSSAHIVEPAYAEAVALLSKQLGIRLNAPDQKTIMEQIGRPAHLILKNLFPELDDNALADMGQATRVALIRLIHAGKGLLYPHVKEVLTRFSSTGLLLRTASNGNSDYLEAVLSHYDLHSLLGKAVTIYEPGLQDKGDILLHYQAQFGLAPEQMVMVGDRINDWDAARKAKCHFIGVAYGHALAEELD